MPEVFQTEPKRKTDEELESSVIRRLQEKEDGKSSFERKSRELSRLIENENKKTSEKELKEAKKAEKQARKLAELKFKTEEAMLKRQLKETEKPSDARASIKDFVKRTGEAPAKDTMAFQKTVQQMTKVPRQSVGGVVRPQQSSIQMIFGSEALAYTMPTKRRTMVKKQRILIPGVKSL